MKRRGSTRRAGTRGFSLLGVVVASGMVILVVFGAVGLLQATRRANARTEQRMVATFLAREAMELVRAIRDGNWLNTGACPATGSCTIFWRGPTTGPRALCNDAVARIEERSVDTDGLTAVDGDPLASDTTNARLFRLGSTYEHDHDGEADWTDTPYHRWVEIRSIAAPAEPSVASECGVASTFQHTPPPAVANVAPAPFTVHAFVRFGPSGTNEIVQLSEDLYPWMNARPFSGP